MKLLNTLVCVILFTNFAFSQVSERNATISVGEQNAFSVDHKDAEKKMVEKALESAIKEFGKVKRNRKAKEWACLQCEVSSVSSAPMNVYYKVEEGEGQITSYLFFDDGTKFISSENDGDAASQIEKINISVMHDVQKMVIKEELKQEEKNLKGFEKELGKLEKKNGDLHDDIEDYKEKILEAEKEIEKNLQNQEDKKIEIEQQKNLLEGVTNKLNNVGRSN